MPFNLGTEFLSAIKKLELPHELFSYEMTQKMKGANSIEELQHILLKKYHGVKRANSLDDLVEHVVDLNNVYAPHWQKHIIYAVLIIGIIVSVPLGINFYNRGDLITFFCIYFGALIPSLCVMISNHKKKNSKSSQATKNA